MSLLPLLALACTPPPAQAWWSPTADVVADAERLDFPATPVGGAATLALTLRNDGVESATLAVAVDGPFAVDRAALTLGAAASAALEVRFEPAGYGPAEGSLTVQVGDDTLAVPLAGVADPDSDADGADAAEVGGTDCDDADPAVHPAADDACYDGLDADCAQDDDDDCDGDGFSLQADCDDTDASASPGATSDADADLADDDCDGLADEDLLAAGDLVLAELHPHAPAWIEVCNAAPRAIALDGLVLASATTTATLDAVTLEPGACAAWCAWSVEGCTATADVAVDPAGDRVALSAGGLEIDAVAVDAAWSIEANRTWSLDAGLGAADNDAADAWCVTSGSPGVPNPACP